MRSIRLMYFSVFCSVCALDVLRNLLGQSNAVLQLLEARVLGTTGTTR